MSVLQAYADMLKKGDSKTAKCEFVNNIKEVNEKINAYSHVVDVMEDACCSIPRKENMPEHLSRMWMMPVIVKDNIDVRGMPTTVGSEIFRHSSAASQDASVIARLRASGAIFPGKGNMDELAAHVSGTTSAFGPTINPCDELVARSPGGSSSGIAAAVAAGIAWAGVGTDTGGSIRIPAAWCGLYGLRPTCGSICSHGVFPRAVSLDSVGLIAKKHEDIDLLYRILARMHPGEAVSAHGRYRMRVFAHGQYGDLISEEIRCNLDMFVESCRQAGHCIDDGQKESIFSQKIADSSNRIRSFEFSRDAGPYIEGALKKNIDIHEIILNDYENGLSIPYDAYMDALEYMYAMRNRLSDFFGDADFIVAPVAPCTALPLDSQADAFSAARMLMDFASLAGVPTFVIPYGKDARNLPIGIQLIGKPFSEPLLLDACRDEMLP